MSGQEQDREALARLLEERAVARYTGSLLTRPEARALADAVLASDWLAKVVREAEQRGRDEVVRDVAAVLDRATVRRPYVWPSDVRVVLARHAGADQRPLATPYYAEKYDRRFPEADQ